jgi:hypothetical protein
MTKSEENLIKYLEQIKAKGYDKLKTTSNKQSNLNLIMRQLSIEGDILLLQEKQAKDNVPLKDDKKELESSLAASSKNPYIRARSEIIGKLSPDARKRLDEIESSKDVNAKNTKAYTDFVKMISALGDKLS